MDRWTFAGKLRMAFALMTILTAVVAIVGGVGLWNVVSSKDEVIEGNAQNLFLAERLAGLNQRQRAAIRDYLLTPTPEFLAEIQTTRDAVEGVLSALTANGVAAADDLRRLDQDYRRVVDSVITLRGAGATRAESIEALDQAVAQRQEIQRRITSLLAEQEALLQDRRSAATQTAQTSGIAVAILFFVTLFAALIAAYALTRTLTAQIGSAVQHVQSSSAELQAAANQQASGSKEQATAMAEITTTISELLATSRQIAESAQRVARVAEQTATAGRAGEQTVQEGGDAVEGIKRQVDAIVSHMLDLGRKSQEIGSILEIITELADQTNILAVNAAIEAVGAGDAGRRFGVVAEEIRKLADRVSGSAKEIRGLVQDVRAAVNASVMATETASKTVDAGTTHFANVSAAFREIAILVRTTNEAAREIELSTKQQASAVEQVNRGVADVAQAARETEITSAQMLDTVSQLATLSLNLRQLVPERAA